MRRIWLAAAAALSLSAAAADPLPAPAPADFDYYVLSLSWSPGFCDLGGDRKAPEQCASGAGFVTHGLWPNNLNRPNPSDCSLKPAFIPPVVLAQAQRVYPSRGLAIHEWRTHGTCTGLDASQYFRSVQYARAQIEIPDAFAHPASGVTMPARDIVKAFVDANDRLTEASVAVTCVRGQLSEVRFCLTPDLRDFTRCPKVVSRSCRDDSVRIAPPR
jgi:ribonuclease T2